MEYLYTEDNINYKDYKFGYTVNCVLNNSDDIEKIFSKGFCHILVILIVLRKFITWQEVLE